MAALLAPVITGAGPACRDRRAPAVTSVSSVAPSPGTHMVSRPSPEFAMILVSACRPIHAEKVLLANICALLRSRELLYMLAWRDVKIRYKQSVMGLMWAILMPSLIVGAGVLVRVGAAQYTDIGVKAQDIESVMVRAVAWSFFVGTIRFGTNSLIGNSSLVTKIAFPKEVFPLAAALSNLFDFLVASIAVTTILLFLGWRPSLEALWALPVVAVLFALCSSLAMILAASNLFYRDVKYLVEVFLTYAIFFTPVLYDVDIAGRWRSVMLLNPVAPLLEALSDALVSGTAPDAPWFAYSAAVTLLVCMGGYWIFKQLEARFAESI
jgi:lipopolysaccharide transport system permease protein